MPLRSSIHVAESERLGQIKLISGKIIEERRKHVRMTQGQLAAKVGIGVRWLREIESGNPKSTIENHFRCAFALGMGSSHLVLPVIFMEKGMKFPLELLLDDPAGVERRCIECIGDYYMEVVARQFKPANESGHPTATS
ncbi:transcriptional regulator [Sphingobium sp. V4]|jgi:transcriptional regulator with XRE-family HTH domain|uniref:transcriptional regulator n=1 Tax=Sphingobium sp. V4 TaxID=3038927 RepID=UPI002557E9BC|nr:transcriptional regulator [Sphingobium sp. V4]WIW89564.1 transcriptional regulator [Sphingobium sp. V4]